MYSCLKKPVFFRELDLRKEVLEKRGTTKERDVHAEHALNEPWVPSSPGTRIGRERCMSE